MDRTSMRDLVRRISRIDVNDVPDTDLDVFIDEGYDRVVMFTEWDWMKVLSSEDIPMVSGQSQYATSAAVHQVTTVTNLEQRYQLRSISKNRIDRYLDAINSSSQPTGFFWVDGTLLIFPVPSSTDTLRVYHISVPSFGPGDNDEPVFSPLFHRILVDWSLHRLWEMEEDFDKSQEYRLRFEESVDRMSVWYNSLSQDTPNIYGERPVSARPSNMPFLTDPKPI